MIRPTPGFVCLFAVLAFSLVVPVAAEDFTVTHHAGTQTGAGFTDGAGTAARFMSPSGIGTDASGNVYVADSNHHTVRRITPEGVVTTVAGKAGIAGTTNGLGGTARFSYPQDVAVDASGNAYVVDGSGTRKISPQGVVTQLAPAGLIRVAVDAASNAYVTSSENGRQVIKKITPAGSVSKLAGVEVLGWIDGLAVTAAGDVLYTVSGVLHRRDAGGTSSSIAVGGFRGVAVEASGNYIAARGDSIVRITPAGDVTNIAGEKGTQGYADGVGSAARFLFPDEVAPGPGGSIYVAERVANRIRHITSDGVVSTLAGFYAVRGFVDGPRSSALFFDAVDIVRDSSGNLFVVDRLNTAIRKITPSGDVTTFAGGSGFGAEDGPGATATFHEPSGMTIDAADNLYISDTRLHTIRKITPDGVVSTVAGLAYVSGATNGIGSSARFNRPLDLVAEPDGTLYVADYSNDAIRRITPDGTVTTLLTIGYPQGVATTGDGVLFVTSNGTVKKVTTPGGIMTTFAGGAGGGVDGTGTAAGFGQLSRIDADDGGNLFVTDTFTLRKITPGAVVTTVAGARFAERSGNVEGTGADARFQNPQGLFAFGDGNVYVADGQGHNIRFVRPPGIDDVATASAPAVPVGTVVQLGTSPATATTWNWRILRRPSGSTAELSAPDVQEPTFTPDVADLFVIELRAEGPGGVRFSRVELTGTSDCEPLASVVASIAGSTQVCLIGTGSTATASVSGGGSETYQWGWRSTPGGSITDIAGATSATYTLDGEDFGSLGTRYLVATVTSDCGFPLVSNEVMVQVVAPPSVTISASNRVYAGSTTNFASTSDAGPDATYLWTIVNGTIEAGQGTRSIRYSAGASGEITLGLTVTTACSDSAAAGVAIFTRSPGASMFHLVAPCRLLDTRGSAALANGDTLDVTVGGRCGVPVGATAAVVNLTAVTPTSDGFAALHRAGMAWMGTSTLNYRIGRTRANNAVVAVASDGKIALRNVGAATHFLIDVTGYFQ